MASGFGVGLRSNPYLILTIFGLWTIMALIATYLAFRLWRSDPKAHQILDAAYGALTSDDDKRRAMIRGALAVSLGSWGPAIAGITIGVDLARSAPGSVISAQAAVVGAVGILILAVGLLLDWTITNYNRPKPLVPPRLRNEPGFRDVKRLRGTRSKD